MNNLTSHIKKKKRLLFENTLPNPNLALDLQASKSALLSVQQPSVHYSCHKSCSSLPASNETFKGLQDVTDFFIKQYFFSLWNPVNGHVTFKSHRNTPTHFFCLLLGLKWSWKSSDCIESSLYGRRHRKMNHWITSQNDSHSVDRNSLYSYYIEDHTRQWSTPDCDTDIYQRLQCTLNPRGATASTFMQGRVYLKVKQRRILIMTELYLYSAENTTQSAVH